MAQAEVEIDRKVNNISGKFTNKWLWGDFRFSDEIEMKYVAYLRSRKTYRMTRFSCRLAFYMHRYEILEI